MTIQTLTFDIYKHNGYLYRRTKCNVKWNVSSLDLQNSQVWGSHTLTKKGRAIERELKVKFFHSCPYIRVTFVLSLEKEK